MKMSLTAKNLKSDLEKLEAKSINRAEWLPFVDGEELFVTVDSGGKVARVFVRGIEYVEKPEPIKNPLDGIIAACEGGNKVKKITLADGRVFVDRQERYDIMTDFIGSGTRITFGSDGIESVNIDGREFEPVREKETTAVVSQIETKLVQMLKCNTCGLSFYSPGIFYSYCPHCGRKIVI
jgi:hypothetical protein